jgi:uncharacterized protein
MNPFFRLAALGIAASLCGAPAIAQQAAPAPAQQPAAAPSHIAAAREVAILSGITRSIDLVAPQFYDKLKEQSVTRPELGKDLNEVLESLNPEMDLQKQQMIATIARILASRMSEAELKDVATFFKSASGKKYVETQPLVLDELVRAMQAWTQDLAQYIMVRVRAEMGKRGHQMQ